MTHKIVAKLGPGCPSLHCVGKARDFLSAVSNNIINGLCRVIRQRKRGFIQLA